MLYVLYYVISFLGFILAAAVMFILFSLVIGYVMSKFFGDFDDDSSNGY